MKKSIWVWPWALVEPGADALAERLRAWGVSRVIVVLVSSHSSSWINHHRTASRRLFTSEPGVVYFPAADRHFEDIKPIRSREFQEDVLAVAAEWGRRHGLEIEGLLRLFTNANLANQHPELASLSMDGSRDPLHLCPNNPRVQAYVRGLLRSVADYPVTAIGVDKIRYRQLPRDLSGRYLDPATRALLSVCFCEHCEALFSEKGIDPHRLRASFGRLIGPRLADARQTADRYRELLGAEAGLANLLLQFPPLYQVMQLRMEVMAELARQWKAIAQAAGKTLTGSVQPPITAGHDTLVSLAGMLGVHYPSLCQIYDPLYSIIHGPTEKVRYEYAWARSLCADFADRLVPGLKLYGDTTPAEVVQSVAAAAELGAARVAFWCYDWASPECLEAIGQC